MDQSQQQPLTVTALTKYLKLKIDVDSNLQKLLLKGEISNFKKQSRGHFYFTLKDEGAQINAIMFAGAAKSVKFEPRNGMQVIVTGTISLYEPSGTYSIQCTKMTEDGIGNLYVAYNQLKEKLEKEGYFAQHHKQSLVKMPQAIGIITSPTGAAVRDMITTLKRRSPNVKIFLYPALVQGEAAAADIVAKIQQVNEENRVDTLIVGRGGGSIEDLWAFNEEIVAQAIFNSRIPVISAVGHETDFTIADFVADLRAPTPTAAAEMAAPNLADINSYLLQLKARLNNSLNNQVKMKQMALQRLMNHYIMRNPRALYENKLQLVTQLEKNLEHSLTKIVAFKKQQLQQLDNVMGERLKQNVIQSRSHFTVLLTKLEMLNPLSVLKKGYSVVTDEKGNAIKEAKALQAGQEIIVKLNEGELAATVTEVRGS